MGAVVVLTPLLPAKARTRMHPHGSFLTDRLPGAGVWFRGPQRNRADLPRGGTLPASASTIGPCIARGAEGAGRQDGGIWVEEAVPAVF